MAFVTGVLLIDAPASALNNAGNIPGSRADNTTAVKCIHTRGGELFPYVSAQAFRYWLRTTLERMPETGWQAAPIFRETKVAYTEANPIRYWDDDLFGYMRAPSKKAAARERGDAPDTASPADTLTRAAPFRVGTLVSIAPAHLTEDFGAMARHEGNPVPHEHQFYRAALKGLFSLDLRACGTFTSRKKTGFRHLDDERIEEARQRGLLLTEQGYRLPPEERLRRVRALFEGLARIEGGAAQATHYTPVTPALIMLAVARGGNHLFPYVVGEKQDERGGYPTLNLDALRETLDVFADELCSPVYIGLVRGYMEEERGQIEAFAEGRADLVLRHPRQALRAFINDLEANPTWME
jgi:CRISPR-associated protein Cst2